MLEELLTNREAIPNPNRATEAEGSGEIVYGTLEDVLPSIVNSLLQLPLVLSKLERNLDGQPATEIGEYVSIKKAGVITGLSYKHIRQAVLSGDLPASNVGAGSHSIYRIARFDLTEWMKKKKGGNRVPPKSRLKELINRHLPDL